MYNRTTCPHCGNEFYENVRVHILEHSNGTYEINQINVRDAITDEQMVKSIIGELKGHGGLSNRELTDIVHQQCGVATNHCHDLVKRITQDIDNEDRNLIIVQDGIIKSVGSKITGITGYKKRELIGKQVLGFVARECRRMMYNKYKSLYESGSQRYTATILAKYGRRVRVKVDLSVTQFDGRSAAMARITPIIRNKVLVPARPLA